MTDLERTKAFFARLGYEEVPMTTGFHHSLRARQFYIDPDDNGHITMNFGDGESRHGYGGFGFCLAFCKDGSYHGHGAFE